MTFRDMESESLESRFWPIIEFPFWERFQLQARSTPWLYIEPRTTWFWPVYSSCLSCYLRCGLSCHFVIAIFRAVVRRNCDRYLFVTVWHAVINAISSLTYCNLEFLIQSSSYCHTISPGVGVWFWCRIGFLNPGVRVPQKRKTSHPCWPLNLRTKTDGSMQGLCSCRTV